MFDGEGWTVIMRRDKMDVSFDQGWDEYKNGFGDMDGMNHLRIIFSSLLVGITRLIDIIDDRLV